MGLSWYFWIARDTKQIISVISSNCYNFLWDMSREKYQMLGFLENLKKKKCQMAKAAGGFINMPTSLLIYHPWVKVMMIDTILKTHFKRFSYNSNQLNLFPFVRLQLYTFKCIHYRGHIWQDRNLFGSWQCHVWFLLFVQIQKSCWRFVLAWITFLIEKFLVKSCHKGPLMPHYKHILVSPISIFTIIHLSLTRICSL